MDYVDGFTFALILARQKQITETDAIVILDSVSSALDYAWNEHKVIHCDIKPDNIMVGSDGIVKILDLGLCAVMGGASAAVDSDAGESEKETITGTPAYMSPEQIYGERSLDVRADIYSLGASLYHLLTGRMLFEGLSNDDTLRAHVTPEEHAPDPRSIDPSISEGFVVILSKMCAKDPSDRYENWQSVLDDSKIFQSGGVPEPLPEGIPSSIMVEKRAHGF
jgi:serine/threonine-protein kinase